jgi:hypothetical protein
VGGFNVLGYPVSLDLYEGPHASHDKHVLGFQNTKLGGSVGKDFNKVTGSILIYATEHILEVGP